MSFKGFTWKNEGCPVFFCPRLSVETLHPGKLKTRAINCTRIPKLSNPVSASHVALNDWPEAVW